MASITIYDISVEDSNIFIEWGTSPIRRSWGMRRGVLVIRTDNFNKNLNPKIERLPTETPDKDVDEILLAVASAIKE